MESRKEGRECSCKPVCRPTLNQTQSSRIEMLTGKNSAVLLLPACTLTYIRWNRVRDPPQPQRPTTLKNSSLKTMRDRLYLQLFIRLFIDFRSSMMFFTHTLITMFNIFIAAELLDILLLQKCFPFFYRYTRFELSHPYLTCANKRSKNYQ